MTQGKAWHLLTKYVLLFEKTYFKILQYNSTLLAFDFRKSIQDIDKRGIIIW